MTLGDDLSVRRAQVAKLTEEGLSNNQIAVRLGVSRRTVGRDRKELGISPPRAPRIDTDEDQFIRTRLAEGWSLQEIARTIGRDPSTLWRRYQGQGWTCTQAGEYAKVLYKLGKVMR